MFVSAYNNQDSMDGGDIGLFTTVYPKILVGLTTLGTFILRVYIDTRQYIVSITTYLHDIITTR